MTNEVFTLAAQLGVIALFGLIGAGAFRRDFRLSWFIGALALYIFYDALLTRGFWAWPELVEGAEWNWTGKTLSLAGMLAIALLPVFGWRKAGVTLKQAERSWPAYLLLIVLSGAFFYMAIAGGDGRDDWETIAFQWTMPGLDEEVFYRGVLLLAMNEAFKARVSVLGAPIGYGGLLTSVLFGLAHALEFSQGGLSFDAATFLVTGAPSLLLLWMRERTGSLVTPIIAHNAANGASTLF